MRFGSVLSSRPAYYDRAATAAAKSFFSSIGVHASTQRWTYTVPTARAAYGENGQAQITVATGASAGGQTQAFMEYTPFGGSLNYVIIADIQGTVGVNTTDKAVSGAFGLMEAGDNIQFVTTSSQTSIVCDIIGNMKYTEFTA